MASNGIVESFKDGNGTRGSSLLERTVQHVFQGILIIFLVWIASTVSELRTITAVTSVEVFNLQSQLTTFKDGMVDRYTGSQAVKDIRRMDQVNTDQELRLRALEKGLNK